MGASDAADPITPVGAGSSIFIQSTASAASNESQGLSGDALQAVPTEFGLHQNYPNPFNPTTEILFDLPEASRLSIGIYDVLGNEVKVLVGGDEREAGQYRIAWSGETASGRHAASGIYFVRMTAASSTEGRQHVFMRKMLMLR